MSEKEEKPIIYYLEDEACGTQVVKSHDEDRPLPE